MTALDRQIIKVLFCPYNMFLKLLPFPSHCAAATSKAHFTDTPQLHANKFSSYFWPAPDPTKLKLCPAGANETWQKSIILVVCVFIWQTQSRPQKLAQRWNKSLHYSCLFTHKVGHNEGATVLQQQQRKTTQQAKRISHQQKWNNEEYSQDFESEFSPLWAVGGKWLRQGLENKQPMRSERNI